MVYETKHQHEVGQSAHRVVLCPQWARYVQSCTVFGQNIVNSFANIPPGGEGVMQVALASNRADGRYVSYGEPPSISGNNGDSGPLVYHPAQLIFGLPFPAHLQGTLAQFFNNRRFQGQGGSFPPSYPFNALNTDSLGIVIYLQGSGIFGINPGEVVLTLNSWGGGRFSFQGQCQNGMILGFCGQSCSSAGDPNTEFVLSLFNEEIISLQREPSAPISG